MTTLVGFLAHTVVDVDEVEAHITVEETALIMKGRILVIVDLDGVQLQRMEMIV